MPPGVVEIHKLLSSSDAFPLRRLVFGTICVFVSQASWAKIHGWCSSLVLSNIFLFNLPYFAILGVIRNDESSFPVGNGGTNQLTMLTSCSRRGCISNLYLLLYVNVPSNSKKHCCQVSSGINCLNIGFLYISINIHSRKYDNKPNCPTNIDPEEPFFEEVFHPQPMAGSFL